ncbi:hypothetical protein [Halorarius litoreus]|uniref:hypothetical protein n=1 Tax=Halorarius litoreus TaxID=2962676 RepID=UPI0020CE0673|nr:hypothetical protein [Halorarius litoreus]
MAYMDVLEERPGVTGVLLGIVLRFSGDFVAAQIETIALLLFAFGVVAALYSEGWWRPAGQALSVAGAFIVLVGAVTQLLAPLL